MQGYCDVYKWTVLKRTSPEVKCLHLTSSRREMCTSSISNVIYHKFSHGAASCMLNGENVNIMLELSVFPSWSQHWKERVFSCKSQGGQVVRWCWVEFQCQGLLLIWIIVGQVSAGLAVGAGGGCLYIFSLVCLFFLLSPCLLEKAQYRLKYCLKWPLNPKQPTNL